MLSGPRAFLGSICSSRFFTSSVVTVKLSREALVRDGSFGGARRGSGTDILEEKWAASSSALSLSRIATDPSGLTRGGMALSAERPCCCFTPLHHSLLPTDWPLSLVFITSFQRCIACFSPGSCSCRLLCVRFYYTEKDGTCNATKPYSWCPRLSCTDSRTRADHLVLIYMTGWAHILVVETEGLLSSPLGC